MFLSTGRRLDKGCTSVPVAGCANHLPLDAQCTSRYESTGKFEVDSPLGRSLFASPPRKVTGGAGSRSEQLGKIEWVGQRLGYFWRIHDAIEVYSKGIEAHPTYVPLYRHRGHRYITLRRFDEAVTDLERAVTLIEGEPDEVEEDGQPNTQNIPLSSTAFNLW